MGKNDAFKSFIRGGFFVLGILALACGYHNDANAGLFSSQTEWNDNFIYETVNQQAIALTLYTNPNTTVSIEAMEMLVLASESTNFYIQARIIDCDTHLQGGGFDDYGYGTGYANSLPTAVTGTPGNYQTIKVHWDPPLPINLSIHCYDFGQTGAGWDVGITDNNIIPDQSLSWGHTATSTRYWDDDKTPWYKLFTGAASPTIEITKPVAPTTITERYFEYAFTATHDITDNVAVLFEIYPEGETQIPQVSSLFNFPIGSDASVSGSMIIDQGLMPLGNATGYTLSAKIIDLVTGIEDVATRSFSVDIIGNPGNTIVASASTDLKAYCDQGGSGANNWFCNFVSQFETQLYAYPPMSYYAAFKDGFLTMNATNSAGYTIIPEFIDDFFIWLWYILFVVIIFRYSNRLFKA